MFEKAKTILKPGSKVLQLTHAYCADGTGCSIVLANCPINLTDKPVKYDDIDFCMEEIDYSAYDAVLITDISPSEERLLDLSNNIILLDHHETALKFHNPEKMRYVTQDYCGTVFTAEFSEEIWNLDLSHLYDFMELTNDYDMWIKENPKSDELNMIYYNIWHDKYLKRFLNGDVNFTSEEKKFIKLRKEQIKEQYKNLKIIDIGLKDGCFINVNSFVNEMCNMLMEKEEYRIIFSYNDKNDNCSIRSNYGEVNIGQILEDLGYGGGHFSAGGMSEKHITILEKKINRVVEEVKKIIGE